MKRIALITAICAFIAASALADLIASGSMSPLTNGPLTYSFDPFAAPRSADDGVFTVHARGDFHVPGDDYINEVLQWNFDNYFGTDIEWSAGGAANEGQIGTASTLIGIWMPYEFPALGGGGHDDVEWTHSIVIPRAPLNTVIGTGSLAITVLLDYPGNVRLNHTAFFADFKLN